MQILCNAEAFKTDYRELSSPTGAVAAWAWQYSQRVGEISLIAQIRGKK